MRVVYSAMAAGSLEIPDKDLEGKSKEERDIYINTLVGEAVADDASDNFEWEIDEED